MYLRDLIENVNQTHIWFEDGMKFVISPAGIRGVFQKPARLMPKQIMGMRL